METQNIEYKESWRDEYLKWICGFANAQGGRLYIGINDEQKVVGVENAKRLLEDIPNKITTNLGIVCDVNLLASPDGWEYLEIVVEPSSVPIAYHGTYHYRSGATKQELKGVSLQQFMLSKLGKSWDDVANMNVSLDVIDPKAVNYFITMAIDAGRLSPSAKADDIETTLDNLRLLDDSGHLKYAALLLFSRCPQRYFPGVQFKIGRFGISATDLMFDDVVEGNILQMVDRVIELLKSKYLISPVSYDGLRRVETLEVPIIALREMLYNAVVHKEYPGVPIQMWVFNDHIELWNPGDLPKDYTVKMLLSKHSSVPRNQNIANVFYKAGFIETWGRGIEKICEEFEKAGMEAPTFEQTQGGVLVTFKRKGSTNEQKNERKNDNKIILKTVLKTVLKTAPKTAQKIALEMADDNNVTIDALCKKFKVARQTVINNINYLKKQGVVRRVGSDKGGHWEIIVNYDSDSK